MLNFQRLEVYRRAIEFLGASNDLKIPRGRGSLADQLRRAALSVPLNIAEASGRASFADSAHHYAIARGSAMECAAIADALFIIRVIGEPDHRRIMDILGHIVRMLSKLCRNPETQ